MSDKLNPITREEMYLAAAAGQEVEVPKPITRKEMFLAKLVNNDAATPAAVTRSEMFIAMAAENGAGGGGGEPGNNAVVQPLEITENGTYTAPVGVDGYNPVSVNVGFDTEDVDFALDAINGEVVGETLYHVTFRDYDGTELGVVDVYEGYDCPDPVASGIFTVEREATKYIRYIHSGWSVADDGTADSNALKVIEENRTLYAVYKEETIYLAKGTVYHPDGYEGCYMVWTLNPDYVLSVDSYGNSSISYDHYLVTPGVTPPGSGHVYPPWWGYRDEITSFVCKCANNGDIGSGWLYNCTNLTDVTLTITDLADNPEDYKKQSFVVGISAFEGCSSLESITLTENTLIVAQNSFDGTALKNITIPAYTKYINEYAFYNCNQLESVILTKTDGWYYAKNVFEFDRGNGTKVTSEQAANPAFVAESLRNGYAWQRMDA